MLVRNQIRRGFVSLACSTPWSQDASLTLSLQKVVVTLDWNSVPVSVGPLTTFSPQLHVLFPDQQPVGEIWIPLDPGQLSGHGDPGVRLQLHGQPILSFDDLCPVYGTVIGVSSSSARMFPTGVGIFGLHD